MMENTAAARAASDEETDGVLDYPHGSTYQHYRDRELLGGGPFVMLNAGIDGFQFFRQNEFEGWPVTATPLCLSPEQRTRLKCQLLLVVTPGPRQPVHPESFLHPIAEELNELAKGIPGLIVPTLQNPVVVRGGILNFTTDQPGGDKISGFKGVNSCIYNRPRTLNGTCVPANCHVYYPLKDPTSGNPLFQVPYCIAPRRTAASIAASAAEVEDARAEGRSVAFQTRLEQESGVKGYSLFFAPSPAIRAAYLYLKHIWDMGPTAAPYDMMPLLLLNVGPHMWRRFAGLQLVNKKTDEYSIIPKATVAMIGRELRGARRTVPMAQAQSLRNIEVHIKSFKAVDWLHFVLCNGEVLLAGRIPDAYFKIFMALSRACRLLFRPRGVTKAENSSRRLTRISNTSSPITTLRSTAERPSGCRFVFPRLPLFWTAFRYYGLAVRTVSSGSSRWNVRFERWVS